ncbi:hypothetical protein QOT17_012768 [Balamuthia mandrillaris]
MCGPETCLPLEAGFFTKLRTERLTQIWLIIWVPLLVMWFVYFGFSISKLATAQYESDGEYLFRKPPHLVLPVFTICPDRDSTLDVDTTTCQNDEHHYGKPREFLNNCFFFQTMLLDQTDYTDVINCTIGFKAKPAPINNAVDVPPPSQAGVKADEVKRGARIYIYDRAVMHSVNMSNEFVPVYLRLLPSGRFEEEFVSGTHTDVVYRRQTFLFRHQNKFFGMTAIPTYELLEYDEYKPLKPIRPTFLNQLGQDSSSASSSDASLGSDASSSSSSGEGKEVVYATLELVAGNYVEAVYKENTRTTGYDFWYFMGLLGGFSFLALMLHSLVFMPFKAALV